eukprot:IDg18250t1
MLWINRDGVSGGAMCPVCMEGTSTEAANADQRFLTWRVMYMPDNRAVLCTPRKRASLALAEMCARRAGAEAIGAATCTGTGRNVVEGKSTDTSATGHTDDKSGDANKSVQVSTGDGQPIGGCVLVDRAEMQRLGRVPHLAYVTASLKSGVDETD